MRYTQTSRILALCLSAATLLHSSFASASISQFLIYNNNQTIQLSRDAGQPLLNCLSKKISQKCNAETTNQGPPSELQKETYWSLVNQRGYYNSYLSAYVLPNSTEDLLDDPFYSCSASAAQTSFNEGTCGTEYPWYIAPAVISIVFISVFIGVVFYTLNPSLENRVTRDGTPNTDSTVTTPDLELGPYTESTVSSRMDFSASTQ